MGAHSPNHPPIVQPFLQNVNTYLQILGNKKGPFGPWF
jgi:hypothetical protein